MKSSCAKRKEGETFVVVWLQFFLVIFFSIEISTRICFVIQFVDDFLRLFCKFFRIGCFISKHSDQRLHSAHIFGRLDQRLFFLNVSLTFFIIHIFDFN